MNLQRCDIVLLFVQQVRKVTTARRVSNSAKVGLGRVLINACIGRMSALGANRTRRDSGNDVNDPKQTSARTFRCDAQGPTSSNGVLECGPRPRLTHATARVHHPSW